MIHLQTEAAEKDSVIILFVLTGIWDETEGILWCESEIIWEEKKWDFPLEKSHF